MSDTPRISPNLMGPPEVSVIVPTFNERGNVSELFHGLVRVLDNRHHWEVIFVDDRLSRRHGVGGASTRPN